MSFKKFFLICFILALMVTPVLARTSVEESASGKNIYIPHQGKNMVINADCSGLTCDFVAQLGFEIDKFCYKTIQVAWNFGDGQTATGHKVNHTYSLPGSYNVFATASSTTNCISQTSAFLTVVVDNTTPTPTPSPTATPSPTPTSAPAGTLLVTGLEYGPLVGGTSHLAGISDCDQGQTCTGYFWIHNVGDTQVSGVYAHLAANDTSLDIVGGSCDTATTLDAGESCWVEMEFVNVDWIRYYGEHLVIESNGNNTVLPTGNSIPTCGAVFKCNGRSFETPAKLSLTGLEAGGVVGGTDYIAAVSQCPQWSTCQETFTLSNTGSYVVSNLDVYLVDDNDPRIQLSETCGSSLYPGGSCQLTLTFNNTNYIRYWGSRLIISGDETSRDLVVAPNGNTQKNEANLPTCGSIYNCNGQ